jgi:tetratricopeptide (TPR) repeat protein
VREALDSAEARVGTRFGNDPAVATEVLTTLGVLRYEFGDDERAMALYDRALEAGKTLPPDDAGRLRTRAERAALLITQQDFDAAAAALEPLLEDARRVFGPGDARTLEWELRLLEAQSKQGIDGSRLDAIHALVRRAEQALGKPNAISAEAALLAADIRVFAGKPDQGLADAEYARDALAAVFGEDHPSTLKALTAVAHGRRAQGRDDEAVDAMRRAWELQKARFGPDSNDALYLQNELAFTLNAVGREAEAEPLFADLVARREHDIAGKPALFLQAIGNLATTTLKLGRAADALALYDRSLLVLADAPGVPPSIRANLHRGRGDALRDLQRYDEAATALDASAAAADELPANDARRFAVQGSRGRLLIAQGRTEEGLAQLDAAIAALQANVPATHPVLKAFVDARAAAAP